MSEITINKDKLVQAYEAATDEQKQLLTDLYGKEIFRPQDITERIKTFSDACYALGEEHLLVREFITKSYCPSPDLEAYMMLRIITAALNQGWSPDWTNSDEWKYYPWFCLYTEDEYNRLDEDEKELCCRVVGRSSSYAHAIGGLVYASAHYASSYSYSYVGSRLAFKTRDLALYAGKQFINVWCDFLF